MLRMDPDFKSNLKEYGYFAGTISTPESTLEASAQELGVIAAHVRELLGTGKFSFDTPFLRVDYVNVDGFNRIELVPRAALTIVDSDEIRRIARILSRGVEAGLDGLDSSVIKVRNRGNYPRKFDVKSLVEMYRCLPELVAVLNDLAPSLGLPKNMRMGMTDYQPQCQIADIRGGENLHRDNMKGVVTFSLNVSKGGASWIFGPDENNVTTVNQEQGTCIGINSLEDLGFVVDPLHHPTAGNQRRISALFGLGKQRGLEIYKELGVIGERAQPELIAPSALAIEQLPTSFGR